MERRRSRRRRLRRWRQEMEPGEAGIMRSEHCGRWRREREGGREGSRRLTLGGHQSGREGLFLDYDDECFIGALNFLSPGTAAFNTNR